MCPTGSYPGIEPASSALQISAQAVTPQYLFMFVYTTLILWKVTLECIRNNHFKISPIKA